jgi:hypothetical protein
MESYFSLINYNVLVKNIVSTLTETLFIIMEHLWK